MSDQTRGTTSGASAIPPGSRPNIVLIVLDDLGYGDLSCYGSPIATPNADRIAREGTSFREAYAGAAVCTPSRAALLTGRYAQRVGLPAVTFPGSPCGLPAFEHTVAEALRGAGYRTGIFGKWHLGDPCRDGGPAPEQPRHLPSRHGFDRFHGIPYSNDMGWPRDAELEHRRLPFYDDDAVVRENVNTEAGQENLARDYTDAAIAFIRESKLRGEPFFAYVPHSAPHEPFHVPEKRGRDHDYADVVREADRQIGRLLDELRDEGLEESTLVLLTSDNGPWHRGRTGGLRGRKTDPFEGGIRVPFVARWPGRVPVGQSREPISFVDVLPTLVELAGAEPPPRDRAVDGISLRGALAGDSLPPDRVLYFFGDAREGPDDAGSAKWQWFVAAARWGRWKLLWPRSVWPRMGREWLFDLDQDPEESNDLSGDPDHAEVLDRLCASAKQFHDEIQRNKDAALRRACPDPSETG